MKLLDICEAIVDCEHKTAPTVEDGEYFVIRTPDIGRGRLKIDQAKKVTKDTYLSWTRRMVPQPGDLVFAREAPVGNVAIILEGQQICLGQRTVLIRPNKSKVNPIYLCLVLLSDEMQAAILAKAAGATVPHVNMADIRALDIPQLPYISTQDRFAWVLSAYDDLITLNQRRIQLLEESARLLYREWFVKRRFPGHESVAVKDGVPEGWKREPLETLCNDIRDAADPSEVEPDSPYLSMEHMPQHSLCLDTWDNAEKVQSTKFS